MWGATALGFLLYPAAEQGIMPLLHTYGMPPPPPGRTQRQHVAYQIQTRLLTFYRQVELEPGLRPRNMNAVAFITHATWAYWELLQRNPPAIVAVIPDEGSAQAYEDLVKTEVFDRVDREYVQMHVPYGAFQQVQGVVAAIRVHAVPALSPLIRTITELEMALAREPVGTHVVLRLLSQVDQVRVLRTVARLPALLAYYRFFQRALTGRLTREECYSVGMCEALRRAAIDDGEPDGKYDRYWAGFKVLWQEVRRRPASRWRC